MNSFYNYSLVGLRVALGWVMLYSGFTKIIDPEWSAAGYLVNAKTFPAFYQWLADPALIPFTNLFNEWALALLGVSLILGFGVRLSSILGAGLMLLYYFPILRFPYVAEHSYIIDDHIIYALVFVLLAVTRAGRIWGLDERFARHFSRYPLYNKWWG